MIDNNKLYQAITIAEQCTDFSIGYLQRKMLIGYSQAAKITEKLEEIGILISSANSKRKINHAAIKAWKEQQSNGQG